MLSPDSLVNGLSVLRRHASQLLRKNSERHAPHFPKGGKSYDWLLCSACKRINNRRDQEILPPPLPTTLRDLQTWLGDRGVLLWVPLLSIFLLDCLILECCSLLVICLINFFQFVSCPAPFFNGVF